jgi:hypothetical protein
MEPDAPHDAIIGFAQSLGNRDGATRMNDPLNARV